MNKNKAIELLKKYEDGTLSQEEKARLETWYLEQAAKSSNQLSEDELEQSFYELSKKLPLKHRTEKWPLLPRIAAAAAIVAVASGIWFYKTNQGIPSTPTTLAYTNDVSPGKQGATLTLANGRQIKLVNAAKGELVNEAGMVITKSADGQLIYTNGSGETQLSDQVNILSTAKGETYCLHLPDGSLVWLNASSTLTYHAALQKQGVRQVKLDGEAYFEIAKDKKHPFIVESNGQQVEVLGTHFNINAYKNEPITKTTLLEGSVKISGKGIEKVLKPGFQAVNSANGININPADTDMAIAWKNNKFIFERLHIQEIMRMIERWYNVEVIYTGQVPAETFWGSVSRFDRVSKVLSSLESTGNVHFKIEGRKIYVSL